MFSGKMGGSYPPFETANSPLPVGEIFKLAIDTKLFADNVVLSTGTR